MNKIQEVYLNPKQEELINSFIREQVKIAVAVIGRGGGKSTILGEYLDRCQSTMPRSRGVLAGPTDSAIRNNILPSIQEHWERIGIIQDHDYIIGKKPPKDWDSPKSKIEDYKNVISFPNGTAISMVSLYTEGGARGGSFQFAAVDEVLNIKRENFAPSLIPAMRGMRWDTAKLLIDGDELEAVKVPFGEVVQNGMEYEWQIPFAQNPYYLSMLLVTSMPFTDKGMWILEYEDNPDAFFIEGTAMDNIHVLGPQYIPNLQASMTDFEFDIEVMNKRLDISPDSFYNQWQDDKHITEVDPYRMDIELELSFDFGRFMCVTVNQLIQGRAYTVRVFYVTNGSIGDLMDKFNSHYQDHLIRQVSLHGDVQGNFSRNPELDQRSLYEEIQDYLRARNWSPIHAPNRQNPAHATKHLILNTALKEEKGSPLPPVRIYRDGCKPLIISMKKADAKHTLQKDKSSEHPSSGVEQQHATHLSDSWDYWYMDRFGHLHQTGGSVSFGMSLG